MASKTAILSVRILTDTRDGIKGLDNYGGAVGRLGGQLDRLAVPAGIALAAIGAISGKALEAASSAQQAAGAVDAVFGTYADRVKQSASEAARQVGLAESQYGQLAAVLGSQLKNLGTPMDAVVGKTEELIGLGADLAATYGGTTADAVAALSSLLRGERDPIERYGVSIKQASIDAKKAELGLIGLTGEADTQADSIATLALLYEQTGAAAGQFGRETDTAAGAQQIANAQFENAKAALGEALLPLVVDLANKASDLAEMISANAEEFQTIAGIIAAVAAVVLILVAALKVYAAIQAIVNIVMAANPIGLIVLAIGLLIGLIVLLVANWEELSDVFADVMENIGKWWDDVVSGFEDGFNSIIGWIQDVLGWFGSLFGAQASASSATASRAALGYVLPAPGMTSYTIPAGAPVTGIAPFAPARIEPAPPTININVDGALDPDSTARQIRRIMTRFGRKQGTLYAGGSTWR